MQCRGGRIPRRIYGGAGGSGGGPTGGRFPWAASVVADESREEFTAVPADRRLAKLLEVPIGTPLLRRERTVLDTGRKPIEFAVVHYRCDRFRLTLNLRQE